MIAPQIPALSPAIELTVAACQFLNRAGASPERRRLTLAVAILPEPDAAQAGATVLRLRQASAAALQARSLRGLPRIALDRALRDHCIEARKMAA